MHDSAMAFVRDAVVTVGPVRSVVELGSYDCHAQSKSLGLIRDLFPGVDNYVGVDCRPGPNVDHVGLAHEYLRSLDSPVDVIVSAEMFEHDPYWMLSIVSAYDALVQNGTFVMTCASRLRSVHDVEASPRPGYYSGIDRDDLDRIACSLDWSRWQSLYTRNDMDLCAIGVK